MTPRTILVLLTLAALGLAGAVVAGPRGGLPAHDATSSADNGAAARVPSHDSPPSASGNLVVALCDGETTAEIPGIRAGETPTQAEAQAVVDRLMAEWLRKNPDARWDSAPVQVAQAGPGTGALAATPSSASGAGTRVPSRGKLETGAGAPAPSAAPTDREQRTGAAADVPAAAERAAEGAKSAGETAAGGATGSGAGGLPAGPQGEVQEGHTYGAFSARDQRIWQAETEKFVQEGHRVFHDAKAFGGTIGISCDMCHPDAANTHPETYPKFQVQLGRVALLRDMINWCIQNPTKGKPLADDDDRLKAMEAYILAQRKGTALEFGKH